MAHTPGNGFSYFQRLISIFVLLAFISTNYLVTPSYAATSGPRAKTTEIISDLSRIQIPVELGKVQEMFKGAKKETVVLLQDAHAIPDAQRNIQKIIDHFQQRYGLNLIAVEGAATELDPQIFKSFPDQASLRKMFESYLDNGEVTGSALAAIFNSRPASYYGIEDWTLYEKGLGLYQKAMGKEQEIQSKIEIDKNDLQKRKQAVYSKELLALDKALESFHSNHSNLIEVMQKLAAIKPPQKGTELALILEEANQNQTDNLSAEFEVKKIALGLKKSLDASGGTTADKVSFNDKFQEFQTSRISAQAFAVFLEEFAAKAHLPLKVSSRLTHSMNNQKRMRDIQGTKLFRDFEHYAQAVKETLFRSNGEKVLDQETRRLELLDRLARLELSREDWNELKIATIESEVMGLFEAHFSFYDNAQARDEVFFKKLIALMSKHKARTSILVAGGFHTESLIHKFKEDGISYVLVMPQIGSVPENSLYREHMKGNVSWKDYFQVEDRKINLYKAFVRSSRDRLLSQSKSVDLQKNWRDQIIRDLAKAERITEVGQYTSFIDETVPMHQSSYHPEWQIKVEKLIDGLRKLDAQGQLTEHNIINLFKPSTHSDPTYADIAPGSFLSVSRLPGILQHKLRSELRGVSKFNLNETVDWLIGLFAFDHDRVSYPSNREFSHEFGLSPATYSPNRQGTQILAETEKRIFEPAIELLLEMRIRKAIRFHQNPPQTVVDYIIELFRQDLSRRYLPSQRNLSRIFGLSQSGFERYYPEIPEILEKVTREQDFDLELGERIRKAIPVSMQVRTPSTGAITTEQDRNASLALWSSKSKRGLMIEPAQLDGKTGLLQTQTPDPQNPSLWPAGFSVDSLPDIVGPFFMRATAIGISGAMSELLEILLRTYVRQATVSSSNPAANRVALSLVADQIIASFRANPDIKELPLLSPLAAPNQAENEVILEILDLKIRVTSLDKELANRLRRALELYKNFPKAVVDHIVELFQSEPFRKDIPGDGELSQSLGPSLAIFSAHRDEIMNGLRDRLIKIRDAVAEWHEKYPGYPADIEVTRLRDLAVRLTTAIKARSEMRAGKTLISAVITASGLMAAQNALPADFAIGLKTTVPGKLEITVPQAGAYEIQLADQLGSSANWKTAGQITATNAPTTLTWTDPAGVASKQKFYRVKANGPVLPEGWTRVESNPNFGFKDWQSGTAYTPGGNPVPISSFSVLNLLTGKETLLASGYWGRFDHLHIDPSGQTAFFEFGHVPGLTGAVQFNVQIVQLTDGKTINLADQRLAEVSIQGAIANLKLSAATIQNISVNLTDVFQEKTKYDSARSNLQLVTRFISQFLASRTYAVTNPSWLGGLAPFYVGTREFGDLLIEFNVDSLVKLETQGQILSFEKAQTSVSLMKQFVLNYVSSQGARIPSTSWLDGFVIWYTGKNANRPFYGTSDDEGFQAEITRLISTGVLPRSELRKPWQTALSLGVTFIIGLWLGMNHQYRLDQKEFKVKHEEHQQLVKMNVPPANTNAPVKIIYDSKILENETASNIKKRVNTLNELNRAFWTDEYRDFLARNSGIPVNSDWEFYAREYEKENGSKLNFTGQRYLTNKQVVEFYDEYGEGYETVAHWIREAWGTQVPEAAPYDHPTISDKLQQYSDQSPYLALLGIIYSPSAQYLDHWNEVYTKHFQTPILMLEFLSEPSRANWTIVNEIRADFSERKKNEATESSRPELRQIVRSELRKAAIGIVRSIRTQRPIEQEDASIAASRGSDIIPALYAAVDEVRQQDDIKLGTDTRNHFEAIRAIDQPVVIEYQVSNRDLGRMGANADAIIGNLMQAAHDASATNKNIITRINLPSTARAIMRLRDHNQRDAVRLEKTDKSVTLYNNGLTGYQAHLNGAPTIRVTALSVKGTVLFSDKYGDNQEIAYQGEEGAKVASQIFAAALVWVANSISQRTFDGLVQTDNRPNGYRIANQHALYALSSLIELMAQYRSELRINQAA